MSGDRVRSGVGRALGLYLNEPPETPPGAFQTEPGRIREFCRRSQSNAPAFSRAPVRWGGEGFRAARRVGMDVDGCGRVSRQRNRRLCRRPMSDLALITDRAPLVSWCRPWNFRLFLGRARLSPEGVVITGWRRRGRYRRRIRLDELAGVTWHPGRKEWRGITLYFRDGGEFTLLLIGAALWRLALDRMLAREHRPAHPDLSGKRYAVRRLYVALSAPEDAPPLPLSSSGDGLTGSGDGLTGRVPSPETPRTSGGDRRPFR